MFLIVRPRPRRGSAFGPLPPGCGRQGPISVRTDRRRCPGTRRPESSEIRQEVDRAARPLPPAADLPRAAGSTACRITSWKASPSGRSARLLKLAPGQPHGETVAGEHRHAAGVVAEQVLETATDLDRSVPVVGQREDATGVLSPCAHEVRDSMHQHPGLAGAGACEHQHVGLLPVVGDDSLLDRIVQALDDGAPTIRGWSAAQSPCPGPAASGAGNPLR